MKRCFNFFLVFTLFFYSEAVGQRSDRNEASSNLAKCQGDTNPDTLWDGPNPHSNETKCVTDECSIDIRQYGPNNQYRCHYKNLTSCLFSKNDTAKKPCNEGFKGPFCQKIQYDYYLRKKITSEMNVFSDEKKMINNSMIITFKYKYRINFIRMNCSSPNSSAKVILYINNTLFCNVTCEENVTCFNDITGKYLNITILHGTVLYLSEMKVSGCSPFWFGRKCDKKCHCHNNEDCHQSNGTCLKGCEKGRNGPACQNLNYENVARHKNASQSSTYNRSKLFVNEKCEEINFSFSADLAVDGNTDQQHQRRACIHTYNRNHSTWQVKLGEKYNISWIRIYNRIGRLDRLKSAIIYVDNSVCHKIKNPKNIMDIKCDEVIVGETIKIERKHFLNFCEFEVMQCLPGFYGDKCSEMCSECKNVTCDQWTGFCTLGCALGYWLNDNKRCTACSIGTFGEKCLQTCHCKNNSNCNKKNGTCGTEGCAAGYRGFNCQDPCSDGEFGENCIKTCHCKHNKNCNKENGICKVGCEIGYKGSNCQEPCSNGTFGEECLHTCHCKNNSNCNKKNGTCGIEGCAAWYKGITCQDPKLYIIIPIVIGLLVLLIIIAGIAIYYKIKKSKKEKKSVNEPNISWPENVEMNFVSDDDDSDEDTKPVEEQESIYMNIQNLQKSTSEVTKDNILTYVKEKKMEDSTFTEEFLKLPKGLLYAHTAAKEDRNKGKNRYKMILPYDHTRVRLLHDRNSSSDYINANYITANKTYIATQGPLKSTLLDFWSMVLQTNSSVIIMLTNLTENGKLKSEQYWPEVENSQTFENISVKNKQEQKYSYYTYRKFCITKDSEESYVEHYQFTGWPDHGVPKEPEKFIRFRNKARSSPNYKAPIIVHCSAGVGRSGTYIVLDILLEEMRNEPNIDVIKCILNLRKDRTLMVQNHKQLEFIYDVLVEDILTGSTKIPVHSIPQIYNQLLKFPEKGTTSFLKSEFESLILPFNTEIDGSSNKKNMSTCYDNEQYIDDEENPIDTTILSGNNMEEEFILFCTPSEEQFANFWNLVFVKRCTLLVMFDNMPSEEAAYWPLNKETISEYRHFIVELVDEHDNDFYIKRTMKVSSSILNMPALVVHQFQFRIWLGTDLPDPADMVKILQTICSHQINKSMNQIFLHCQDGISKCGLFSALYIITELLKTESLISIAQLIRQLKRQKKEIISDYTSYHYCWLIAKVFLPQ